ncbi:MAG TPA: LamG-like jellyroll fold domain-containing protein [Candidatus Limnocylindrales bacterium]|nr:LamG-like jellyroll fold domain-containing protein [Candidatus Limnocylindrales bacterium]
MKNLTTFQAGELLPLYCSAAVLLIAASAVVASDYPATILGDNPVSYYRLEETSGSVAADSSLNHFDGTYVQNSTGTYPQLVQPGIDTNSVFFNGGANFAHVIIPYNILLSPTTADGKTGAPFSAECWVQATSDSLADYTSPLAMSGAYSGAYAANGSGWNFYQTQGPNSSWALFIRGGSVYGFNSLAKVILLQWYHLAVTWDGTAATFYVNGMAQNSAPITYYAVDPVAAYDGSIGSGPQTGHGAFAGGVDEVAFYTNALTAAQIMNHYRVGTNSFRALPVPPGFLQPPSSVTNYSGTEVTFSTLANGTPPLFYQWRRGTTAIAGATTSKYSFLASFPADDGAMFSVTVTNSVGATNSDVVTLTVLTNVDVQYDPFSITRNTGSKAAFRVVAASALPLTYQWFKGASPIQGATNETLWLNNVQAADGADYHAHLVNPFTSVDSANATLTVQTRAVTVPIKGYAKVVTADDPVAYWRLDETSGSAGAVDAVGSFDGTYDNSRGDITYGVPTGIPHETDTAIDLSDTNTAGFGSGGVIRIPYALELNPHGPWSVEAWVRPDINDVNGNFRTVLSSVYNFNFSTAVYGWAIYQHPNGGNGAWTLAVFNGSGGPGDFISDFGHIPLLTNSWYHLVLTDDGTSIQLYVNGVAGSAHSTVAGSGFMPNGINGDPGVSSGAEVLGQRTDGAFLGFSGAIDDVAFYNYALSPSQVRAHYSGTFALTLSQSAQGPVLSWPFGTLQSAPQATGTYSDVPNASSPYTIPSGTANVFYRVRWQMP